MAERKIKLLHLHAPLRFGGGEVFLANFYAASSPWFENRTILFSRSDAFVAELNKISTVSYSQFYNRDLVVGSMKQYVRVLCYSIFHIVRFRKLVKIYKDSDFVIGHGFPFTVVIPLFRFLHIFPQNIKTIHFQHHRLRRPEASAFWKWLYRILLSSFDLIIVDAVPVRDDILRPLPELKEKIFIIGTGLPFDKVRAIATQTSTAEVIREIVQAREHRIVAIYASRYVPHKNHQIFLRLLQQLRDKGLNNKLLLVLTGREIVGSDFQEQVKIQKFNNSVLFTGALEHDDVFRAMKLSHICLFPSLEEGFGLSILEALALGVPTLVFENAIPGELHPFLMLADDEEDFIRKAIDVITNPEVIKQENAVLQQNMTEVEYFDINAVLKRLHERLSQCIND